MSSAICFNLDQSKNRLTPQPHSLPSIYRCRYQELAHDGSYGLVTLHALRKKLKENNKKLPLTL